MTEREKMAQIIAEHLCPQGRAHKTLYGAERMCYSRNNFADCEKVSECVEALIAASIGDVTEWKERAERMHKEALKQKQRVSDYKHGEDTMRNQLECAIGMASEMEHAKRTLEILYMSGAITEETLRDAVKQAKLEIEEEEADDR